MYWCATSKALPMRLKAMLVYPARQAIEKYTSYQDEQDSVARGDRLKLVLDQGSDIRQGSFHIIGCSHIYDLK